MLLFEDADSYWRSVKTLPESKLGQVGSHEWKAIGEADGYVFIPGPADITKIREAGKKYSAATAYNDEWYRRAKRNRLRGARLGLGYVTEARARSYGFDLPAGRAAFDGGRTTKVSASENEDLIRTEWAEATGPKDLLGYLDIGLNPNARSGFLQDAIVAGNVYVAVGANDEVPGGKNKTDFFLGGSLTGANVTIDGRPVIQHGNLAT